MATVNLPSLVSSPSPSQHTPIINASNTGTSVKGPTVDARAWSLCAPNVATATAIATSKLLLAAAKLWVADIFITKTKLVCNDQGEEKYNSKVYNQWSGDPDDGRYLMIDLMSLLNEKDEDRKEEADQRPRSRPFQHYLVIPRG